MVGVAHHEGPQRPELGLGFAHEAFVGVKHNSTLFLAGDWSISEADALDLFSLLSFVHRRLDNVVAQP